MDSSRDADSAAIFDFVDTYLDDVERGEVRPLAEYLGRYPGHEESVAREYLLLQERHATASAAGDRDGGGDERRVGPYRLVAELGRGGQGAVFLAEDTRIARTVALKLLPGFVSNERRARLRQEAEAISRLHHAGISRVHEADIDGDVPYIAMQYVEGEPMAESLEAARAGRATRSSWRPRDRSELCEVLALFERVARALHAAHEAGVIHRDVKPGNLLVTPEGDPLVLDFGLAFDERSEEEGLTRSGESFGTPGYMSPEQLRGTRDDLDRRTDVYSLGVALYEALTLRRPFEAEGRVERERAILERPVPDPAQYNGVLPDDVRVVLETALEKDRSRRYPTAYELAEDLRRIREYEPIRARPAGPGLRFRRWVRRQPVLATALLGTLLVLSTGLGLSLWSIAREQRALRFALGRHLAERSSKLLAEDHAAALALGVEAVELAPNYLTRAALFSALEACALERVLESEPDSLFHDLALGSEGELVAGGFEDGHARVWRTADGEPVADFDAGRGPVRRLAFDPSGERLAIGTAGGSVHVFPLATQAEFLTFEPGAGPILWVEFSPTGDRLAVLPAEGPARIVTCDTRAAVLLATRPLEAGCVLFSPDGERVVTASLGMRGEPVTESSVAHVWDASSGERIATLDGHSEAILHAEIDPLGRWVATGSRDGTARLWDLATGSPIGEPLEHEGPVTCAAFDRDGKRLATTTDAGLESRGRVWTLADRSWVALDAPDGSSFAHASFSPDGTRVATSSFDMTVRIWDAETGVEERTFRALIQPLRTHWSADGSRLVTLSKGPWSHVWTSGPFPDTYRLAGHSGPVTWVGFDPEGERVLTASEDGTLRLWRTPSAGAVGESGALVHTLSVHAGPVRGAAFLPDGEAASWSDDGTVRRWQLDTGAEAGPPIELDRPVADVATSPDGTRAVCISAHGEAWLVDLQGGARPIRLEGMPARRARFAPDGGWFAVVGVENAVDVRDARTGELRKRLPFEPSRFEDKRGAWDVAVHASGRELAIACAGLYVRFRDPLTGEPTRADFALFEPRRVAYASDGEHVLVSGHAGGGSIRVQDARDGTFVRPEIFHTGHITGAAFGPNGDYVLSGSRDTTAYVWNARTGQPFAHLTGHGGPITSVAFGPAAGDLRVVLGSEDGTASVWPVDPLPAARARLPRELEPWEVERERRLALPLRYR